MGDRRHRQKLETINYELMKVFDICSNILLINMNLSFRLCLFIQIDVMEDNVSRF